MTPELILVHTIPPHLHLYMQKSWLLPRDIMHSARPVVLCMKRGNIFSNILPSGRRTILLLLCQTLRQYSDGDPPNRWDMKKSWSSTNISFKVALSRKWCKIGSLMVGRHLCQVRRSMEWWPSINLSDLECSLKFEVQFWISQKQYKIIETYVEYTPCATQWCNFEWPWVT